MYNVKRSEGGLVTITDVANENEVEYTLGTGTFITFKMPGSDVIEVKQVKDFTDDASLLQAIAYKVEV